MARDDLFRRSFEAGTAFLDMSRERAEALVKDLVKAGEVRKGKAQKVIDDVLERSRKGTEELRQLIRREIADQVAALGLATKEDIARLEARLGDPAAGTAPPAGTAPAAAPAPAGSAPAAATAPPASAVPPMAPAAPSDSAAAPPTNQPRPTKAPPVKRAGATKTAKATQRAKATGSRKATASRPAAGSPAPMPTAATAADAAAEPPVQGEAGGPPPNG